MKRVYHVICEGYLSLFPEGFSTSQKNPVLLITSRSRATVTFWSSYFITALPFLKLTRASSTPFVDFRAFSTEVAQPPHVMPCTRIVIVRVMASDVAVPNASTKTRIIPTLIRLLRISLSPSSTLSLEVAFLSRLRAFLDQAAAPAANQLYPSRTWEPEPHPSIPCRARTRNRRPTLFDHLQVSSCVRTLLRALHFHPNSD